MTNVSPKSNVYAAIASPASGSLEAEASKLTVSGAGPNVGDALRRAIGGLFGRQKKLPTNVYAGVFAVLSVALDPVTLVVPLPLKVRGLMLASVLPALGALLLALHVVKVES